MKTFVIAAALVASFVSPAQAQEVKGITMGMDRTEVEKLYPQGVEGITVGGISSAYASIAYDGNDKVESFSFFFDSGDFFKVMDAVKTKYPKIKCVTSTVQNGYGASFEQVKCDQGTLHLTRFSGKITEGSLMMFSPSLIAGQAKLNSKKASDI